MAANFSIDDIICGKNTCNIHRVAILKCPSVGLQIRCWLCDVGKLRGADLITVKSLASKNAFRLCGIQSALSGNSLISAGAVL